MTQKNRRPQLFSGPVEFDETVKFNGSVDGLDLVSPALGVYARVSGKYQEIKAHPFLRLSGRRKLEVLQDGWYILDGEHPRLLQAGDRLRLRGDHEFLITGPWR